MAEVSRPPPLQHLTGGFLTGVSYRREGFPVGGGVHLPGHLRKLYFITIFSQNHSTGLSQNYSHKYISQNISTKVHKRYPHKYFTTYFYKCFHKMIFTKYPTQYFYKIHKMSPQNSHNIFHEISPCVLHCLRKPYVSCCLVLTIYLQVFNAD